MADVDECVEHGLQIASAEVLVKGLGKAFQIYIGGIHLRVKRAARRFMHVARGHGHAVDANGAAGIGHVHRVFGKYHRVVVGEGHGLHGYALARHLRIDLAASLRNTLGRGAHTELVGIAAFGDVPVLAKLASQVAARRAKAQNA